jgi:ribosomal protein S27AE
MRCEIHNCDKVLWGKRFACPKCGSERLKKRRANKGRHQSTVAWDKNNPEKRRAHSVMWNAILAGKLKQQPCERCGAEKAHGHHDNYSKPLDVRWLCSTHHRERHRDLDVIQNVASWFLSSS